MSVKVEGLENVLRNLTKIAIEIEKDVDKEVEDEARRILARARELVPVETGALRDSGEVRRSGDRTEVRFSTSYAANVHELHPTGSKFLERPALGETQLRRSVARRLRKKLK